MFTILIDTLANAPDASQKLYWLELRVRGQIVQFSSFNEFLAYWVKLPSLHSITVLERNVFGCLFNFDFNSRFGRFLSSERVKETIKIVKVVNIKQMPERVEAAYREVCDGYSEQPTKGTAKEFYALNTDNSLHGPLTASHISQYDDFTQLSYPIVADWLNDLGIDLRTETVYVLWD